MNDNEFLTITEEDINIAKSYFEDGWVSKFQKKMYSIALYAINRLRGPVELTENNSDNDNLDDHNKIVALYMANCTGESEVKFKIYSQLSLIYETIKNLPSAIRYKIEGRLNIIWDECDKNLKDLKSDRDLNDTISRQSVRELIWKNNDRYGYSERFSEFTKECLSLPPVNGDTKYEVVSKGCTTISRGADQLECKNCKKEFSICYIPIGEGRYNFCPNCGVPFKAIVHK